MSTSPVMWTNPGESCTGCRTDGIDNDGNGYVDDWRGWDFVNNDNNPFDDAGHGTHVAGTIGALANNATGVAGINWNVKIMALKFLDSTGSGTTDAAVEAVRYATSMGITASNNSWGGGDASGALLDAITEADAAGSLFVAAAGNERDALRHGRRAGQLQDHRRCLLLDRRDGGRHEADPARRRLVGRLTAVPVPLLRRLPLVGRDLVQRLPHVRRPVRDELREQADPQRGRTQRPRGRVLGRPQSERRRRGLVPHHWHGSEPEARRCLGRGAGVRTTNGVTFEAILEEGTNDVVLQYKDVDHGDSFFNYGASATVGVENDPGSAGKQFLFEQPLLQPYQAARSLRFTLGAAGPPDVTPPAAPTGLVATAGAGQVALDWADNVEPDLAGYTVERRAADGTRFAVASPTASAYTETGLTIGTSYTYRVVARDTTGNPSTPSATASATPFGTATHAPGSYAIGIGRLKSGSLASLTSDDGNRLVVDATKLSSTLFRAELVASLTVPPAELATLRALTVRYDGHVNQSTASLTLRVLNQRTGAWVTIDGPQTGVTADRLVTWDAPVPADFVSASGEVRVSAFGERSRDFLFRSDLISITVGY